VKAPGVTPEQSTTALPAKAKLERRSNEQANSNLYPEQLVIVILTRLKLKLKIGVTELYRSKSYAARE
jgi:hypothetical protein